MTSHYNKLEFLNAPVPTVQAELELAELMAEGQHIIECLERGWLSKNELQDHETPSP